MTWTDKGIDEWNKHHMSQLMAFRCNYTSVNFGGMWNTGLTLEDSYSIDHAPMRYSMLNAARIDKLLELCKKRGIYVMPCLFQTQWGLSMHWNGNAYKKFCKDSTEIFTNPEVDRLLRNRYRYTMARYGYSTNILAWELFNEIEFTQGYLKDRKAAMKYIENMADYLREIDPNKHLVTVSCTMDGQVQNSNLDAVIVHPYGRDTADIIMSSLAATYPANKPTIGGESGISYPDARAAALVSCSSLMRSDFSRSPAARRRSAMEVSMPNWSFSCPRMIAVRSSWISFRDAVRSDSIFSCRRAI